MGNPPPLPGPAFIELEKVIASKSPRLARFIPGFIVRYLKRVIHQDELNEAMVRFRDLEGLEFIDRILDEFGVRIVVKGIENVHPAHRYMIVSNHPLGGLDGMALMKVIGSVRPDIVFPVNDLLMNVPNIRSLFIPINKHGSNAQNVKLMDETFASQKTVLYFPAGLCSRKTGGTIMDLEWKKTFISRAKKFRRDILPVHTDGRNSSFFYNLANLRKKLGIRANIEMLYLVDEMFKQRNKTLTITIGRQIPYTVFAGEGGASDLAWAALVRKHVYRLQSGIDDFNGLLEKYPPETRGKSGKSHSQTHDTSHG